MNRDQTAKFLDEVRSKRLCAYIGSRCDCKYGADHVGSLGERGNGCPEMYDVIAMFNSMTDREFDMIQKRANKGRFRYA